MGDRQFVVKFSFVGCLVQVWLSEDGDTTENLDRAAVFPTVWEAYRAASYHVGDEGVLGLEIIFRGLCHHNPC